jgi:hypothetical protein
MQPRNSALKGPLDLWSIGGWKVHRAKLLLVEVIVVADFVGNRCYGKRHKNQYYCEQLTP